MKRYLKGSIFIVILVILSLNSRVARGSDKDVKEIELVKNEMELTKKELESLEKFKAKGLKMGIVYKKSGYEIFSQAVEQEMKDFFNLDATTIYYETNEKGLQALKNKEVDVLIRTEMSEEAGNISSESIYECSYYTVCNSKQVKALSESRVDMDLLRNKRILIGKDYEGIIRRQVKSTGVPAQVISYATTEEALEAYIKDSENTVVVIDSWDILKALEKGLNVERIFRDQVIKHAHIEADLEEEAFIEVLNKYLDKRGRAYFTDLNQKIHRQEVKKFFRSDTILNKQEKQWIENTKDVTVKIIHFRYPILYKGVDGTPQGLAIDYFEEFSELTDIKVNYLDLTNHPYKEDDAVLNLKDNEVFAVEKPSPKKGDKYVTSKERIDGGLIIFGKEMTDKTLREIFEDEKSPIGVIKHSLAKGYFEEIDMRNFVVYDTKEELYKALEGREIEFICSLDLDYYERLYEGATALYISHYLQVVKSLPVFTFNKESEFYYVFEKALSFMNTYAIKETTREGMEEAQNNKIYEYYKQKSETAKLKVISVIVIFNILLIGSISMYDFIRLKKKHKKLQIALEKARIAEHTKEMFMANMSHEIRTPMNTIVGIIYFLKGTPLTKEQLGYTKQIENASNVLLGIVNDVLDLSKMKEEKMVIAETNFELYPIFLSIVELFEERCKQKKVDLVFDYVLDKALVVKSDSFRLSQVAMNFMSNAVKFTSKGSIILEVVALEEEEEKIRIRVGVKDTGIGIQKEKLDKVWEAFEQVENVLVKNYQGTGLGLPICKNIVEKMGGKIEVESEVDKGSNFYFELLLDKGRLEEKLLENALNEEEKNALMKNKKILLVEDNEINSEIVKNLIEQMNVECEAAYDGIEAIEKWKERGAYYYDLILMDVHMPRMNGYETVDVLKKEMHIQTPIIFLTATVVSDEIKKEYQEHVKSYLLKPIKPVELKEKLIQAFFEEGGAR